jgi:hypothetical protein
MDAFSFARFARYYPRCCMMFPQNSHILSNAAEVAPGHRTEDLQYSSFIEN